MLCDVGCAKEVGGNCGVRGNWEERGGEEGGFRMPREIVTLQVGAMRESDRDGSSCAWSTASARTAFRRISQRRSVGALVVTWSAFSFGECGFGFALGRLINPLNLPEGAARRLGAPRHQQHPEQRVPEPVQPRECVRLGPRRSGRAGTTKPYV
jgi:hypothetical protein